MTPDTSRRVSLAEWHLREARVREVLGDADASGYHLEAAADYLTTLAGRHIRPASVDELSALFEQLRDDVSA